MDQWLPKKDQVYVQCWHGTPLKRLGYDITNSDMATRLIEAGGYKRDNEILAKQVHELLEHNKELSARIEQLESHTSRSFWNKIWGRG